ncbi:hypothetical protein CFIMG_000559RA [Ceratocystis fimbriata CBS 114723]|uniref:Uncharacterized protein n=1 Tax=Ceratocystis fimbriata CBS 114723 TaxID=1035309 RepID=A0A2C5XHN2_9PEZI|nr:hypothetical protein CFIMG_000559RA [Ceratocystis fimbriata CBS 114723]
MGQDDGPVAMSIRDGTAEPYPPHRVAKSKEGLYDKSSQQPHPLAERRSNYGKLSSPELTKDGTLGSLSKPHGVGSSQDSNDGALDLGVVASSVSSSGATLCQKCGHDGRPALKTTAKESNGGSLKGIMKAKDQCSCCKSHGSKSSPDGIQEDNVMSTPGSKKSVTFLLHTPESSSTDKHKTFGLFAPGSSRLLSPSPNLLKTLIDQASFSKTSSDEKMDNTQGTCRTHSHCHNMAKKSSPSSPSNDGDGKEPPDQLTSASHKAKRSSSKSKCHARSCKSGHRSHSKMRVRICMDKPCNLLPNSHYDPMQNVLHIYGQGLPSHHDPLADELPMVPDGVPARAPSDYYQRFSFGATGVQRDSRNRGRTCSYHLRKVAQDIADNETAEKARSPSPKLRSASKQRSTIFSQHFRVASRSVSRCRAPKPCCQKNHREVRTASRLRSPSSSSAAESIGNHTAYYFDSDSSLFEIHRAKSRSRNKDLSTRCDKHCDGKQSFPKRFEQFQTQARQGKSCTSSESSRSLENISIGSSIESDLRKPPRTTSKHERHHRNESTVRSRSSSPDFSKLCHKVSSEKIPLPGAWNWDTDYSTDKKKKKKSKESKSSCYSFHQNPLQACCHNVDMGEDHVVYEKSRGRSRTRDATEKREEGETVNCCKHVKKCHIEDEHQSAKNNGVKDEHKEKRRQEKRHKHSQERDHKREGYSCKHRHSSRTKTPTCNHSS